MYFKLLYRSGHVNQVRCIYSVSAWNSSAKTFASALAFAIYCHSQKDNCDTLNQARHQARSPPPCAGFLLLLPISCVLRTHDTCKLHCRYCKAPMLSKVLMLSAIEFRSKSTLNGILS